VDALELLGTQTTALYEIPCELDVPPSLAVSDNTVATHLYRIVQEAVSNAAKYADASHIRIAAEQTDTVLTLRVVDDGVGIPAEILLQQPGLGLRTMRHRASVIGAQLNVRSAPGEGTAVDCEVPLEALGQPRTLAL
jgi:signal transduction histidine kinase